jgi:hypothetical protein
MAATKKNRMDLAFAALLSDDDAQVLEALTRIGQEGDAKAIHPLLMSLARARDPRVQQRITSMLYQVKAPGASEELFNALDDAALLDVRTTILATFWNAGIDVRDHLEKFITLAIEGDADETFECLTIIENQEIWPEKAARLGLGQVRKAAELEKDDYKASMLRDLQAVLEDRLGVE